MAQKGNLLSVRQDIRVVDATIRDGGLCNDFRFSDNFVRDLYKANLKAGVDYMEFGYKASKEIFDEDDFGKWKFCNDDDIRAIIGEGSPKMKVAVMADVGRTDFETDIIPKNESPIDLVRIATYINTIPAAVEMIEYCAKQGYETTIIKGENRGHQDSPRNPRSDSRFMLLHRRQLRLSLSRGSQKASRDVRRDRRQVR